MEPPPAPIDDTPTTGMTIGKSPTVSSVEYTGRPSLTNAMSALVPPMSKVIRSRYPARTQTDVAPMTPEAGPESIVSAVAWRASRAVVTPPFDFVM